MNSEISSSVETANNGRKKNGRFAKGNNFATGNPYTQRVAHFRRMIVNIISPEDIAEIIFTLSEKAKTGDLAAAKIVLDYTVGRPQAFETPDESELNSLMLGTKIKQQLRVFKEMDRPIENELLTLCKRFSELLASPAD